MQFLTRLSGDVVARRRALNRPAPCHADDESSGWGTLLLNPSTQAYPGRCRRRRRRITSISPPPPPPRCYNKQHLRSSFRPTDDRRPDTAAPVSAARVIAQGGRSSSVGRESERPQTDRRGGGERRVQEDMPQSLFDWMSDGHHAPFFPSSSLPPSLHGSPG